MTRKNGELFIKHLQTVHWFFFLKIANPNNGNIHPTQKPTALFEYLINTYTNRDDIVLDTCMGSASSAIACINTERNYIGFENDTQHNYYDKSQARITRHLLDINKDTTSGGTRGVSKMSPVI